jgi:hypothetical protein
MPNEDKIPVETTLASLVVPWSLARL